MPEIAAAFALPWKAVARIEGATALAWKAALTIESIGGPYTPPPAPPGSTGISPGGLGPLYEIASRDDYTVAHTLAVTDLRSGAPLDVGQISIAFDDGSALWTVSGSSAGKGAHAGAEELFKTLTTGEQPASIEVDISGQTWQFLIDTVNRPRRFGSDACSFSGRSLAALAGSPFQFESNWINDAPTTAAQIATTAQLYTDLVVNWGVEDWLIPTAAWSFTGTPLAVVQQVAQAIGADVRAERASYGVSVTPRYAVLPNEWVSTAPDVQIHFDAVESDSIERADRPAYNAVYVAGEQQGQLAFVRMDGTTGTDLAPLVTDALLTDLPALRQRGEAILGAAGKQVRVTRTLQVLSGAGEPGVIEPGSLVRCVDPGETWVGMVRGVQVSVALPVVRQTLTIEHHTEFLEGTYAPKEQPEPIAFAGPVPDFTIDKDVPWSVDLSGYWSGPATPFSWSMRSGALPAGLGLDGASGVISGTPTAVEVAAGISLRGRDAIDNTKDSNQFQIEVIDAPAVGPATLLGMGASPYVLRSVDGGDTWAPATVGLPSLCIDLLAIGGGVFLAAPVSNGIFRSVDGGDTWTRVAPSVGESYKLSGRLPGLLLASRNSGSSLVSSDGVSWSPTGAPLPAGADSNYPFWHSGRFIVSETSGGSGNSRIWSSEDGASWTLRFNSPQTLSWHPSRRGASNGTLALYLTIGTEDKLVTSSDGILWSASTLTNKQVLEAAWSNGQFFGFASSGEVLRSADGATWTRHSTPYMQQIRVVWTGTQYLTLPGSGGSGNYMVSADGVTWATRSVSGTLYWSGCSTGPEP